MIFAAPLHHFAAHRMFSPDADLSRKERGHRGVRPRHPVRQPPGAAGGRFLKRLGPRRFALWSRSARYDLCSTSPRGRQASTWSARGGGRESRFRAASLITRKNNTCGLSRVRPRRLAKTRAMRSRPPQPAAGITGIRKQAHPVRSAFAKPGKLKEAGPPQPRRRGERGMRSERRLRS